MKRIIEFISDIFWLSVWVLIWGTVGSIAIFLTLLFSRYAYIWALLVTALFLPFHISDFRNFFREKNWLALTGRFICLYAIGSFLAGFVAFFGGLIQYKLDRFDLFLLFGTLILTYPGIAFWAILVKFYSSSRLYREIRKILEGLHIIGVLWKNY